MHAPMATVQGGLLISCTRTTQLHTNTTASEHLVECLVSTPTWAGYNMHTRHIHDDTTLTMENAEQSAHTAFLTRG